MKTKIAIAGRCMKDKEYKYYYTNTDYLKMLETMNAVGIPIFPSMDPEEAALNCEGLLLPGGADVNPKLYHQLPDPTVTDFFDEIDDLDLRLIHAFMKQNKPILGICRGLQILNVAFGGTLVQDIPNHDQKVDRHQMTHPVTINKDCELYTLVGDTLQVNSLHHQIIDQLGEGLKAAAYSPEGYIEAIECPNVVAVQWHPEALMNEALHMKLFEAFIQKCK